ncbi:hypothetical protein QS257_02460 [Terrilactibacillus sp. S3-3]|nr:hypothetical protein QS257_02460 [Terrilactibacillus sp. S3-3]
MMKTARLRLGIIPFLAMIVSSAIVLGVCQPAEAEEQPAVIKIQKLADDIYYPVIVAGVKNTQVKNDLNRTFFLHAKEIRSHDIDEKKRNMNMTNCSAFTAVRISFIPNRLSAATRTVF